MKTLKDIKAEEKELIKELTELKDIVDKRRLKAVKSRLSLIRLLKNYLESNPRPEYIEQAIKDLSTKIGILKDRYDLWRKDRDISARNPKAVYYTEVGMANLKKQLRTMKYLIK